MLILLEYLSSVTIIVILYINNYYCTDTLYIGILFQKYVMQL